MENKNGMIINPGGYAWHVLPVERFAALPETVQVEGLTLKKKEEFHVTIANIRGIARQLAGEDAAVGDMQDALVRLLEEHIRDTPIEFVAFLDDIRLAITPERTSLAARCTMRGIEGYFDRITEVYGTAFPVQPTHVSLYTLTGGAVGIDSTEEMESFKKVRLPEVQQVLDGGTFS